MMSSLWVDLWCNPCRWVVLKRTAPCLGTMDIGPQFVMRSLTKSTIMQINPETLHPTPRIGGSPMSRLPRSPRAGSSYLPWWLPGRDSRPRFRALGLGSTVVLSRGIGPHLYFRVVQFSKPFLRFENAVARAADSHLAASASAAHSHTTLDA